MKSETAGEGNTAGGLPSRARPRGPTPAEEPPAASSIEADIRSAIAAGDLRAAVSLCATAYGARVGRLCMAMLGAQSEAEEVAQDTLLTAYQAFPSYRNEAPLLSWLMGIARKKCLKSLAARRRQANHGDGGLELSPGEDAEALLVRRERAELARRALARIKPTEREALLLRYQAELPYDGVALACEVDVPAARKRVSRGLLHLRAVLTEMEANAVDGAETP